MTKQIVAVMMTVVLCMVMGAPAGTRADLSGDVVVDFQTTMDMPLMNVTDLGNAPDTRYNLDVRPGGFGSVNYAYSIGKFEVTAGQYCEFLNAVATTDTYGLYSTLMWERNSGCKIQRIGAPESYVYSVGPDWADRPVNYMSWWNAARFCNWLTNGMPTGAQDLSTTEDGSYFLNGLTSAVGLDSITRKLPSEGGQYYLPTDDEWYKAAYYNPSADAYYDYPGADSTPNNDLIDPDPGNNANYVNSSDGDYVLGYPLYRTEVGEFENSASEYGTFDQAGNLHEWTEAIVEAGRRGVRGGSYNEQESRLHAAHIETGFLPHGYDITGFRIVYVPEPATLILLAMGGMAILKRRR
ncbi:MAG: SUMF1/EgtB/PvdO family nonheme iron enzyme [Planctomycetota bacterium]|jgi:formylglycine-generating enzyme required for sulfatase activity